MNESRIKALLSYLSEDPDDAFTLYALAMEYLESEPRKAEEIFDRLLLEKPEYLPTYLMAANYFKSIDLVDKARQIYLAGIELAQKNKEQFTLKELQSGLNEMLFEDDR